MENEMEEIIQENSPDMVESEETMEIPVQDNLSDTEIVEEIQTPSDNLPENEITGDSSSGSTYYVTNVYEIVEEQASPLWDSSFHDMSAEVLLLCMIFLLLLVQFVHSFFKGSHWFK